MRRLLATAFLTMTASTSMLMAAADSSAQEATAPDGSVPTSGAPGDSVPGGSIPDGTVPGSTTPGTLPLVPVPSACTAPPRPDLVFVGTLVERDFRTGRFAIEQMRAGSADPFAVGGLIDVRYGGDVDYLDVGTKYLVSARRDPVIGLLASTIREPAPLLGGDDVVGVAESDVECPRFEDPIRTFLPDGSTIDSAVLAPLAERKSRLVAAFLLPIGVAFGIVFVLAALRWGVGALLRGVASVVRQPR